MAERVSAPSARLRRALLTASPLLFIACSALAQSSNDSVGALTMPWSGLTGCRSSPRPSDETREMVDLVARMAPHTANTFATQAELLAQEVDVRLRTMLGGSESNVPDAPSTMHWLAVPAELAIVAHSDGSMTWRGFTASGDSSAVLLLSAALDSARKHDGALMIWPDDHAPDSIDFRLSLLQAGFQSARGFDSTYKAQMGFVAFALREPTLVPALPINDRLDIVYPNNNQFRHVTGQLIVEVVVDTTGRAEMSTFRDVWPADKPRLTGALGQYYNDFLSAIRTYAAKAKFVPASIGGCTIRQWIRIPVKFQGPHFERPYSQSQ
jgi:hypothetical protein